jgi:cobalt-zinc-cadmium efflux system membrane fusion protein
MDLGLNPDKHATTDATHEGGHAVVTPPPRKGLSGRTQMAILIVVGAAIVLLFFVGPAVLELVKPKTAEVAAPAAPADGSFRPTASQWANLRIQPVKLTNFRTARETDGKIALDDDLTTPVFSPFSGRVAKLFAKAGDHVEAGAPLMAIEASEYVQGQNDLITAIAAQNTARAQLRLAQTSERRQHDLYLANAGALKDWQQSQVDLATAQGGLNGADIALGAVRNRLRILGKTDKEIAALESGGTAQRFNPSSVVVAPIAGTVTQRAVGLGQYIVNQSSGGSNAVFSIGDLSRVWLVANVREMDAPTVHLGDDVEVRVPAYPDRVFKAKVVFVAPSIDPTTHRLPVRAEIENADGALKPEMFAAFSIITGKEAAAPGVPASAIVYEGDKAHVFVADPAAKTIAIRPIEVGRSFDGLIEARAGLKAGEQVVTSGSLFIDRALQGD